MQLEYALRMGGQRERAVFPLHGVSKLFAWVGKKKKKAPREEGGSGELSPLCVFQ